MKSLKLRPAMSQLEAYKSIRKPLAGPSRAHPDRKMEYKRPQGNWRKWID